MWSKTWAITLAIISRLTVTDCLGPALHRSYPSADGVRDPEEEIDAAYRMREELARENALKHLKLLAHSSGNSAAGVEYAEPRHRYYGNKYHPSPRIVSDDKPPDMTDNHRQGFPKSSFNGPKISPIHINHHQPRSGAPRGHVRGSEVDDYEPGMGNELKEPVKYMINTDPYVEIRSGIESFQPIAAAIAMQEHLNAFHDVPDDPPSPPPFPEHPQPSSDHEPEVQDPPPHPQTVNSQSIDPGASENRIFRPGLDDENQLTPNGAPAALQQSKVPEDPKTGSLTEVYFLAVIAGCSVAGFVGLVLAGVFYYRLRKKVKAASDVEYPAYGVIGPNKEREGVIPGDRKLAQSAQMYHYQHQRQQMIASERLNSDVNHRGGSDAESEDENEEGDYTVFECPGLATNGDMEVRNPLFNEQTPVTAPSDIPGTPDKK